MLSSKTPNPKNISSFIESVTILHKPHFRYVDFDRLRRAKHIRVKSWKFHSCNLSEFQAEIHSYIDSTDYKRKWSFKKESFDKILKAPTIKRSLKYTKRFRFSSKLFWKNNFLLQLCKPLKLETLNISITAGFEPFALLKAFLNSKLKNVSLTFGSDFHPDDLHPPKLISFFRKFKKSQLLVINNSNNIKMLLNTDNLQPFYGSHQFTQKRSYQYISTRAIINSPNSFQKISYQCVDNPKQGIFILPDLPPLPNLKELQFAWISSPKNEKFVDISWIEQFSKLASLSIQLDYREPETLDFLADLQNLKEFYFSSKKDQKRLGSIKDLPNLTKLENFGLRLDEPKTLFSTENIKQFISKNKDLKSLDLTLTIQNIEKILDDLSLSLSSIKKLKLSFPYCREPFIDAANQIVKLLKKLNCVQQLSIEFHQSESQLNTIFFQGSLVPSLKSLSLKYHNLAKLENNNFACLKGVFTAENLENLKALDLNFSRENSLGPGEFSSVLESLSQLQTLEKFKFRARVSQFTPAVYNQLENFLISIRHIKSIDFSIKGVSQANGYKIRKNLLPKFPLSKSYFSLEGFI